jgi:precorrin-6B C5,15-methyltransferase / cobalt-precorrin-6B C5,C15-methyltransferase
MCDPATDTARILVLGMTAAGASELSGSLLERIYAADLLAGGQRQLAYLPDFSGEKLTIGASASPLIARLRLALERGERAVVLASGDPLWYGIGATLRRVFPVEALAIVPAPTAFQLAFAALAEPWHDAALLSAHGRPLANVIAAALAAPKAAILTDNDNTPPTVARALCAAGLPPTARCAICENLGGPQQRIVHATLAEAAIGSYAPLNVFVVWGGEDAQTRGGEDMEHVDPNIVSLPRRLVASSHPPGLPDDAFATDAAQITKREVRLLSLAELALGAGETLWDIGAGSGSLAIEAARAQPTAQVFAIERRAAFVAHISENQRRFPTPNLTIVAGEAPAACADLPNPHAVFVGGSSGHLAEIVALAREQLQPGGRLVVNLATVEHLAAARSLLPAARVMQVQVSRGVPIQELLRFEALNPIWIVVWTKE